MKASEVLTSAWTSVAVFPISPISRTALLKVTAASMRGAEAALSDATVMSLVLVPSGRAEFEASSGATMARYFDLACASWERWNRALHRARQLRVPRAEVKPNGSVAMLGKS